MTMTSIKQYFGEDHDRLDGLFTEFQGLKRQDAAAAKLKFKAFITGLSRHIVWEEEILFPLFEERTGMANFGPTEIMRQEHLMIKRHLDAIHDKVRVADPESDLEEKALLDVLKAHNLKEEQILYPAIDAGLDADAIRGIKASMDALPEERYAVCCGGAGHAH